MFLRTRLPGVVSATLLALGMLGLGVLGLAATAVAAEVSAAPATERNESVPTAASRSSRDVAVAAQAARPPLRPPLIPAQIFASQPLFEGLEISPAGTQIVATSTAQGKVDLVIHDLTTGKTRLLPLPPHTELETYQWAGEKRILFSVGWTVPWLDDEAYATREFVYDLEQHKLQFIGSKDAGLEGGDVIYVDPSGDWILIALQASASEYPGVYRVDLATGHRRLLVRPQTDVWDWYADSSGVVRAGFGYRQDDWFMVYREADGQRFHRLPSHEYDDEAAALDLYQIASGSDQGYVLSNEKTGRYALYRYDYAAEKLGELVFESATNDIDDAMLTEDNKRVIYVEYTDDRDRVVWFDPMMKLYQELLDADLPGQDVEIVSMNRKRDRFIVWAGQPEYPGTYYFFDAASNRLHVLSQVNKDLDEVQLARTTYTRYRARDGVEIPAYLTLPKGRVARGLPLIILPHGGPYGVRDSLGYDPEVQFLANRGYAVLQPNYRGSTGYGEKFAEMGDGQWGRAMQDDLDDGMDWLVRQGVVDAKRVCLYGSSYGGYAALWGATRSPERYRCAASFAGVSDLRRNLKYQEGTMRRGDRGDWHAVVQGDEKFHLDSVSPLQQVAALKVPVLIGHGTDDKVVLPKQSSLYEAALKRSGKIYEYYTYPGEGHGFAEPVHFRDWLERLDAFLARYNPAD